MDAAPSYRRVVNLELQEKNRKRPTHVSEFATILAPENFPPNDHDMMDVAMAIDSDQKSREKGKGEGKRVPDPDREDSDRNRGDATDPTVTVLAIAGALVLLLTVVRRDSVLLEGLIEITNCRIIKIKAQRKTAMAKEIRADGAAVRITDDNVRIPLLSFFVSLKHLDAAPSHL